MIENKHIHVTTIYWKEWPMAVIQINLIKFSTLVCLKIGKIIKCLAVWYYIYTIAILENIM